MIYSIQRKKGPGSLFSVHRVITTGRERYSIPFFFHPNFDTQVTCLPTCCSAENPAKYKPTTSGQHLLNKYALTHTSFEVKVE